MPRGVKEREKRRWRARVGKLYVLVAAARERVDTDMSRSDSLMSAFMQLGLVKTADIFFDTLPCFRRSKLLALFTPINAFPCANVLSRALGML